MLVGALIGLAIAILLIVVMVYVLTASGRLTVDTGWGRRMRPLGPQVVTIAAPRERVFELLTVPYLSARPPRALREKVEVLERADGMVLAAHRTPAGPFTTITVETVTFEPPSGMGFRLVRGPVPHVAERFDLREADGGAGTELTYTGELGTDGWGIGAAWGRLVGAKWEQAVAGSLAEVKAAAERSSDHGSGSEGGSEGDEASSSNR